MSTLSRREQALLVQLADGTLSGRARARAEAIPGAERLVQRQRLASRALGGGPARAPERTTARLPRLALAGALATVLVLLWFLAPSGPPTTQQVADIAQLTPTQAAPAKSGSVLSASVEGVPFPEWGHRFGWHETGMRRDEIDGRRTATVFYEHMGHRLAYTILSGPALPRPEGARVVERDGLRISVYRDPAHGGHDVAVFERGGHTCVVAGHVLHLDTLLKLSAWKGGGSLRS